MLSDSPQDQAGGEKEEVMGKREEVRVPELGAPADKLRVHPIEDERELPRLVVPPIGDAIIKNELQQRPSGKIVGKKRVAFRMEETASAEEEGEARESRPRAEQADDPKRG